MLRIGIINCGVSNVSSVYYAFLSLGFNVFVIEDKKGFDKASHLVLPGVGSFAAARRNLRNNDFDNMIQKQASVGKPLLGICLGMQLLAECGEEVEITKGLNIIPGKIVKLKTQNIKQKLPHMGWNQIKMIRKCKLISNQENMTYYFAHSYIYENQDDQYIKAYCQYGVDIPAIVEKDNVIGLQFHPEKSQSAGLALLNRFVCLGSD